jgi:hypothetical protein
MQRRKIQDHLQSPCWQINACHNNLSSRFLLCLYEILCLYGMFKWAYLSAFHHFLCYLFHHSQLPIVYPNKPSITSGSNINTFCSKGQAEFLAPGFSVALTRFTDADHARCVRTRHSVSVYLILHNSVAISWGYRKQTITSIHSTSNEITALHKSVTKTLLLWQLLTAMGFPPLSFTPIYKDNQGTIKLYPLTDTVWHYTVKFPGSQ